MPLDFLKFVTDGWLLGIVTLGSFRKARISKGVPLDFLKFVTNSAIRDFVTLSDFYKS